MLWGGGLEGRDLWSLVLALCIKFLKDARQLFHEPEVTDPEKIEVCW